MLRCMPWFFATFGGSWRLTPEHRDGVAGPGLCEP